ncbi:P-type conjugative transfer protein TrbL [Metapseudomonas otitidis]|uniref:P-type conjugative transfer protein TrbL n=1 Tax=Metapseudomonas otitidis TaxID=319939 RepID=UPI0008E6F5AD|nr:P-type conjugative transfer protein TrbL [Pseudomonas otitidis]SFA41678.1 type IV secretion system protein TrbL [Pseudomonas otitidis]
MKTLKSTSLISCCLMFALYSGGAAAQLTNQGMLDQVITEFSSRASTWQAVILSAASWLFWTLGTISLAWTFGMMALRKADLAEFFAEFCRFILFFGFYLWLLRNGPEFASSIIRSLQRLGEQASGISSVTPSGIVDIGFMLWKQTLAALSAWSPVDSLIGVLLSLAITVMLALIAINMLILLVSGWVLIYAGIFFLGFGGSRWTSDMAINYYKTVLGVAIQLFVMVLLVGIGSDLLTGFYAKMTKGTLNFEELGVMLIFCLCLLLLTNKVPPMLAGVITGSSTGAGGIGNFGAGAAVGAAMGAAGMASAAMSMAGSTAVAGAQNVAGGISAIKAAMQKAQGAMDSGSMPSFQGAAGQGDNRSSSPLAEAMGDSGSSALQAARLAVGTTAELAKGAGAVIGEKAAKLGSDFMERAQQTLGGQTAAAIRSQEDDQPNSIGPGGGTGDTPADEIAAFVNRGSRGEKF